MWSVHILWDASSFESGAGTGRGLEVYVTFKPEKSSLASGGDRVVSVETIRRTEGGRKVLAFRNDCSCTLIDLVVILVGI